MEELDLRQLARMFFVKWWVIALCVFVCVSGSAVLSFFIMDPVYESSSTLYISKKTDEKADLAYNDVLLGAQLVKDYREIAKSRLVVSEAMKKIGIEDIDPDVFSKKVNVSLKNDTRVIQITAQDGDAQMSADIANAVSQVFRDKVAEIMRLENVQIIDSAVVPQNPVKPNKKLNIAISVVLGLMIGCGIVIGIEYFDRTIKSPEDVKRIADLPVIGVIPEFEQ